MNIRLKEVEELTEHQILNIILLDIKKIFIKYDFMGITQEDFNKILLMEIKQSKKTYKGKQSYIDFISNRIEETFNDIIKDALSDADVVKKMVNKYIETYFEDKLSYDNSINNLKKLELFFNLIDYTPDSDLLIKIIEENADINKMVALIFDKNKTQIISGNIRKILNNDFAISIVEIYCMLNNIEIKDSEEFKINFTDSSLVLSDSVKTYLVEISRRPLLTLPEEKELLTRIKKGDNCAKEIFIESNLKLVVKIAYYYLNKGLDLLDLIQEGNIGLMKAVEKFDITRNIKFSTYATQWIRQSITRAIADKVRNIRIPVYIYNQLTLYYRVRNELEKRLDRKPTDEELAREMNTSIEVVENLQKYQDDTLSLNAMVTGEEDGEMEQFVTSNFDIEDIYIYKELHIQINNMFKGINLTQREIEVLILRFGLNGEETKTLEEIGKGFGLTRERVRQIEASAIKKIRNSNYIKSFSEYMGNPKEALENIEIFRKIYRENNKSRKILTIEDIKERKNKDKNNK